MPAVSSKLGPGTLTIGAADAPVDVSCQVTGFLIEWDTDEEDPITPLCGDQVSGGTTFTASASGTFLQDLAAADGFIYYTWDHKGETVPFEFIPNTAAGATCSGNLVLTPLSVGGDEYGTTMTSEFEWTVVGDPQLVPPGATTNGEALAA